MPVRNSQPSQAGFAASSVLPLASAAQRALLSTAERQRWMRVEELPST